MKEEILNIWPTTSKKKRWYPIYPETPRNTQKYPKVKKIPENIRSRSHPTRIRAATLYFFQYMTRPDIEKTLRSGHWLPEDKLVA